jgi:integrase
MAEIAGKTKRERGDGSVYQRPGSRMWHMKFYQNGRAIRESTGETSKRKAITKLQARLSEVRAGKPTGPKVQRIKIEELAEDVMRDYRINGLRSLDDLETRWNKHLKPFFGGMRAVDISADSITKYIDNRLSEKASNATVNRELAALKRMFSLGVKYDKVYRMPTFPHLQEDNIRTGFLSDADYVRLATETGKVGLWLRAMFEVGYTYGWRVTEIQGLKVGQVDLLNKVIRLEPGTTKNREGREAPMTDAVYTLLTSCVVGKAPDDYVFERKEGRPVKDFRGTWQNVTVAAKVPGLLFHDLRRTGARNLRRAGVAEGVIMKIGGWKTGSVFRRYDIIDNADTTEAVRKLEHSREQNLSLGHSLGHSANSEPETTSEAASAATN